MSNGTKGLQSSMKCEHIFSIANLYWNISTPEEIWIFFATQSINFHKEE